MDYVQGEQQDVDSKDSVMIRLDFWPGNGKKEVNGKTWPYTSFEINGQNKDIKRKLSTSIAFSCSGGVCF